MVENVILQRSQLLEPPQPLRMGMDESLLQELADSIKRHGLLMPLIVVPVPTCVEMQIASTEFKAWLDSQLSILKYEIVDGHRRYVALGMAGIEDVRCSVHPSMDDAKFGVMLDANMMREEVTPAEEGAQIIDLVEKRGFTMPQLMKVFGRSEAYINDRANLVRKFPEVFLPVSERKITWTQAKEIMRCPDKNWRAYLIDQAITHGATYGTLRNLNEQYRTQQLIAQGQQPLHTPEHVIVAQNIPKPECEWCHRTDDPTNLVSIQVHSYHVRDLREFLARCGVHQRGPLNGGVQE